MTGRKFMDEGVASVTSSCPDTGTKFGLRMVDKYQGKISLYGDDDCPLDTWLLSRGEMKALYRLLSVPCKNNSENT